MRRSRWIKLLTPGRIIEIINTYAGGKAIKLMEDNNDDLPLSQEGGDMIRAEPHIETVIPEDQGVGVEPGMDPTIVAEEISEVTSENSKLSRESDQLEEKMKQTQEVQKNKPEPETPVESEVTEEEYGRVKRVKRSST